MKTSRTDTPTELLTAAQMRAIEQAAIDAGEVTGLELMERAGHGVVDAILAEWPNLALTPHRAVILCGPGNNGGDGFVVARLLKQRGWEVEVFLYGDPDKLPPDARVNYERWGKLGPTPELTHANLEATGRVPDLVIDALFGTGLSRALPWSLADAVRHYAWTYLDGVRVVAVDLPSGLSSDVGASVGVAAPDPAASHHITPTRTPGEELGIALTVTFHSAKLGHYLGDGPSACGKVAVTPIGLAPTGQWEPPASRPACLTKAPRQIAKGHGHKYHHGHALILSGPATRTGAARLAARGALRIGAGLVTVAAPPDALPEHAAQLTAIMLREAADPDALRSLLEDDRLNALCLGPGMGPTDHTRAMVKTALSARRKTVLDADALTAFAHAPDTLFAALHDACVLTPHAGEFARLFPDIAERLTAPATTGPAYSKLDATREAAQRAGCTVLFKGPDTVIAAPSGAARINASAYDRAAPWLATAGSGDVLAGFIAGLLARGFIPLDAASTAAWAHTECALSFGPGLIAEDLPEELPRVLRALGL